MSEGPSLYAGSAAHYARGRVAYSDALVTELVRAVPLEGTAVLLDVGCGPGSLTLLLAPHVARVVGVDADREMVAEAARAARRLAIDNAEWRHLRAEELPADLPRPDVVTFAQSFHWVDRPRVAAAVRSMLRPGGVVVHVGAVTHAGVDDGRELSHPRPPRAAIESLLARHLGGRRGPRADVLAGRTAGDEDDVFRAAGFHAVQRIEVPGRVVDRNVDELVASVYSLSTSTPRLFGDGLAAFDAELRQVLAETGDGGWFSEAMRPTTLTLWR